MEYDKVDNVYINRNNNNIKIIENTKPNGNKEYSYKILNYIIKIRSLNEGNRYTEKEGTELHTIMDTIINDINIETKGDYMILTSGDDDIFHNYLNNYNMYGNLNYIRSNINKMKELMAHDLINNDNKDAILADIWNENINILIIFIKDTDEFYNYISDTSLQLQYPEKVNTYTKQELTIIFDPNYNPSKSSSVV